MERESTGTTPLAVRTNRDHNMHEAPYKVDPAMRSVKKRRLLWCCGICSVILIVLIIVIVTLIFTVFRKRDPTLNVDSLTLQGLNVNLNPAQLLTPGGLTVDLTLDAVVSVKNPNYAGFSYQNTTALISYHDKVIGESPIPAGEVKARKTAKLTSTTTVHISGALINQNLTNDLAAGVLPLVTSVRIEGTAKVIGFIKLKHVKANALCAVSIFTNNLTQAFDCDYNLKL